MKKVVNKWTINLALYPLYLIFGASLFYRITYGNISLSFHKFICNTKHNKYYQERTNCFPVSYICFVCF